MTTLITTEGPQAWLDTVNAEGVSLQLMGLWNGLVVVEGTNDQTADSIAPVCVMQDGCVLDQISVAGAYTLKVSSRYIRLNVLTLNGGPIEADVIARASIEDLSTAVMAAAADEASGVTLGTRPRVKMDPTNAIVLSDAPPAIYGAGSSNSALVIPSLDTTGYESIAVQLFGTFSATVTFYTSNDGANWVAVAGWPAGASATPASSATAVGMWSVPAIGKLFRVQITAYTSGTVQANCVLRMQTSSHSDSVATNATVNVSQIGGTNTVTAGVNGLQAVGGNIAPGTLATANPVPVGGVDASGLTRRLLTDNSGRMICAFQYQLALAQSAQNVAAVPVQDHTAFEGQSTIELLSQILVEMRVQSAYLAELPTALQLSKNTLDEPSALRQDPALRSV